MSKCSVKDLSPGNIEEAEEAEPDDEFKDAIEVRIHFSLFSILCSLYVFSVLFISCILHFCCWLTQGNSAGAAGE